ncbi:MAG: carboxypeptidase regulatory-like domain-containing protein [Flavisolibacter sp.]
MIIVLLFSLKSFLFAQETTSTLSGTVSDAKGIPVTGATVSLTHEPTNKTTTTQTNSKGIFVVPNLKPGGPYTVVISYVGMTEQKFDNVNLSLGNNPDLVVDLQNNQTNLQEVVITTSRRPANSGLTVGSRQLTTLPTLGRSLSDFTRLTPQSNNNSFAGTNFRYNNVTLDGAVNNDAIGFSNSFGGVSGGGQAGTAGAGTRTNPYSLDVIQEVQVQLAPYDVKLGNFTGGSVNAVTKSGSNDVHGSLYGYGRNQSLVGKSVDGLKTKIGSNFYDYQTGATFSGPLIHNRLFFIINGELTRRQEPTFYNAGDPGAAISLSQAQQISDFLKTNLNYDVGSYGAYKIQTNSNKLFTRLDWNATKNTSVTLRAIYTNGYGNNLERSSTNFQFSSTDFTQHTKNVNLVGEIKSKISNDASNQVILSYINVHEYRDFPGQLAPFMDIGNGAIWAGTWREASVYNNRQKTFELTDNFTLNKGINRFTFGTHNEFYDLTYGFINSWNGRWEYSGGLTNGFLASKPSRIRGAFTFDPSKNSYAQLNGNVPNSNYQIDLYSVYAEDEITLSRKFKITPGIRFDYADLPTKFPIDPVLTATADYQSNNATYSHTPFFQLNNKVLKNVTPSPRLGFNYDVNGNQSVVIRGGTGIFQGRVPFAWFGYASTLTGTTLGNIDYKPGGKVVPLALDPNSQKDTVSKYGGAGATSTREVDIFDNNFKLPTIWRSNIAIDIRIAKGYKLTLDAMYTKSIYDVKFQQINIKDTGNYFTTGPTSTFSYLGGNVNKAYSNIYFLTNTKEGYRYNLTAQLSKVPVNNNSLIWNWNVAYTYGMSKDISNGIRNSFASNFEVNPAIIANNPNLSFSNFDLRHRIVAFTTLGARWNDRNTTSLSFFYSGQSGSPYTAVYTNVGGALNNAATYSLPYIPNNQADINLADVKVGGVITYSAQQQWQDLSNFIDNDSYLKTRRGKYAERNGLRTPWNHELDMKLMHEFHFKGNNRQHGLQISLDVFNVLNLISNSIGRIYFVTNTNNYTVNLLNFVGDANGKAPGKAGYVPTFNFTPPPSSTGRYYTVDPINSRWQGQLGIKYTF